MSYPVIIKDAELQQKMQGLTESVEASSPQEVARLVEQRTGIKVHAKFNEENKSVEVKRLLID
jgi:hypothetical protein